MSSSMPVSLAASSSSSRNWVYDVFPSFSGEDVRVAFLSHFLKELDRKSITAFRDNEMKRSQSIWPELVQAIRGSRIAVVLFSKNYASSSWCLNELLEIVRCQEEFGQKVIPVFYGLDPTDVRKQTGDFGKMFEETCKNKTDELKLQWRKALKNVANILGYHSMKWGNEAAMIEEIANDVLGKLHLTTPSKDLGEFVGIKDQFDDMSELLQLESEEAMMIGIWGPSGIGKTTIARVLFNQLSPRFQDSIYIDESFVSKSVKNYKRANPDYNLKLDLQRNLLSEISGNKDLQINHLGAVEGRLNNRKVLIVIDDLEDQVVLDALVRRTQWFGRGSRIIVVTKDKQFLRAHGIHQFYEVCLPSDEHALEMFSRCAFNQNSPPDDFKKVACEVVRRAGNLPLGLNVLGSYLRGRGKEYWRDTLPSLLNRLNGKVERTLKVSYDGLDNRKDATIFRHIACIFEGEPFDEIKMLLEDSNLDFNIGIQNLVDKSLIYHELDNYGDEYGIVKMHSLVQEMGKEIVRLQSDEPGKREFLTDSKEICDVLENNSGTRKLLGITLNLKEIEELHMNENSFKEMRNLLFLKIYRTEYDIFSREKVRLPKGFDYFPPKLRLLSWDYCPLSCLPRNFPIENLVKLQLKWSKLEKLWEGVPKLPRLKTMDLWGSENLKEISDLSMATNLETLLLTDCSSLVELPSSIQYLNKLTELIMSDCWKLETLPTGINLKSLDCIKLADCSRLKTFPDISTNISYLVLNRTGIEEVPWWIEKFTRLRTLEMTDCDNLQRVSLNLLKLKHLEDVSFKNCRRLAEARFNDESPSEVATGIHNILSNLQVPADEDEAATSSSFLHDVFSVVNLDFFNCSNFDSKVIIQQQRVFMQLVVPGEEVPSYFTHRTSGSSLNNIPFCQPPLSQRFFIFRGCTVLDDDNFSPSIDVWCRFIDRHGNHFDYTHYTREYEHRLQSSGVLLFIFDFCVPLAGKRNYVHMDIHLSHRYKKKINSCGIKLLEDEDDRHIHPNILPHVSQDWQECGDLTVERSKSSKSKQEVPLVYEDSEEYCGDVTESRKRKRRSD